MTKISQAFIDNPVTTIQDTNLLPMSVTNGSGGYLSQDNATQCSTVATYVSSKIPSKPSAILASTVGLDLVYNNGPNNDGVGATLTAKTNNTPLVLDGQELDTVGEGINSTCFIKNQGAGGIGAPLQNGLYCLSQLQGSSQPWILTRHAAYNSANNITEGTYILISGGNTQAGQFWYENNASPLNIGTDPITFAQASVSLETNNSATFAPHGSASGTIFTDWGLLCAYLATLNQDQVITIYFDPGNTTVCSLPAGTYAVPPHCAFVGVVGHLATSPVVTILTNSSDTILTGLEDLTLNACNLLSQNQTASPVTVNASGFKLCLIDSNIGPNVGGRKPIFSFTNSTAANIYLYGTSSFNGGAAIIFDSGSASASNLYAYGFNFIGSSGITNPTGLTITAINESSIDPSYTVAYPGKSQPQQYTGQQNFASQSLTDAATIAWNLNTQQVASVLLTAAVGATRVLGAPTNLVNGGTYILVVTQSSTGSNALTYNAVFKFPGGVPPVLSTVNNAIDLLSFFSDGTNMYLTGIQFAYA